MSNYYTINVTNNSDSAQSFYFFQAPVSSPFGVGQSNSLFHGVLPPYASSGSVLTFCVSQQYFACAQTPLSANEGNLPFNGVTATQPIDLSLPAGPAVNNATNLSVDPLGLSPAFAQEGVMPGAFRISTPAFDPQAGASINIGLAVQLPSDGSLVLSSLLEARPNQSVDLQPVEVFYVKAGVYPEGYPINVPAQSDDVAVCNATRGQTTFNVSYNQDQSWSVTH